MKGQLFLVVAGCIFSTAAAASIPSGTRHGPWHVVSISSVSGDGESDDPSVVMIQERGKDRIELSLSGSSIIISVDFQDCVGEEEFDQAYTIPVNQWLAVPKGRLSSRIKDDIGAWTGQARLACSWTKDQKGFDLKSLDAALSDFTDRVRHFAPVGAR